MPRFEEIIEKKEVDIVKEKNPFIGDRTLELSSLPSNGLFYPKDAKVSWRLFSIGELTKMVKMVQNVDTLKMFIDIMLSGITVTGLNDKYDIVWGDFLYISILRKFPSLARNESDPYLVEVTCQACNHKQKGEIDLDKIGFEDISDNKNLSFNLNGKILKFKPLTIRKYVDLETLMSKYDDLDRDLLYLACCIEYGETLDNYKLIFESTDKKFLEFLGEVYPRLSLGLVPYDIVCGNCNFVNYIKLDSDNQYVLAFPCIL